MFDSFTHLGSLLFIGISAVLFYFIYQDVDLLANQIQDNSPITKGTVNSSWYWGQGLDDKEIYRIEYEYVGPNGTPYSWNSFANREIEAGTMVDIQYVENEPSVSRIKGLSNTAIDPMQMTGALFFLLLAIMASLYAMTSPLKKLHLLKHGILTTAVLQRIRATKDSHGEQVVFRFQFRFQTLEGKTIQTLYHSFRKEALRDEEKEMILYHSTKPKNIVAIDDFPDYIHEEIRAQATQQINQASSTGNA